MVVPLVNMILPNNNNTSFLEQAINNSFLLYKDELVVLFKKSWKEEDYNETSYSQFTGSRYLIAIQLAVLVYLDYIRFPSLGWTYYVSKFDLEKYAKCFKCDGINLDKILEKFGLPSVGEGVEHQIVEETLIVEALSFTDSATSISLISLIEKGESCSIFLEDDCLYKKCN